MTATLSPDNQLIDVSTHRDPVVIREPQIIGTPSTTRDPGSRSDRSAWLPRCLAVAVAALLLITAGMGTTGTEEQPCFSQTCDLAL